jgi:hypothetical protein
MVVGNRPRGAAFCHYMSGMTRRLLTRTSALALAAPAAGIVTAATTEPIGQGGRSVPTSPTSRNNSNFLSPNLPNYVPPAQTSPFIRPQIGPRGTYGYGGQSQRRR